MCVCVKPCRAQRERQAAEGVGIPLAGTGEFGFCFEDGNESLEAKADERHE